jgi:phage-related minor tail protein
VSSQIDFNNKTMFLSQDDVTIANQLKGIYGNDVPAALASSEASALRLNTAFRGLSSSIENDMVNGLTDILSGAKSASQGFADLEAAVVKAIEQMIIKITIVEPLMRALQSTFSSFSGVFGFASGGVPGASGAQPVGSASGHVFSAGQIVPFASPTIAPMALFGEAGPEAIMPLRRGSDRKLGVAAGGGGGGVNVTVNVQNAPAGVQSQASRVDSNGNVSVDVILKKPVNRQGSWGPASDCQPLAASLCGAWP